MDHWKKNLSHEIESVRLSSRDRSKQDSDSSAELDKRNFLDASEKEAKKLGEISSEDHPIKLSLPSPKFESSFGVRRLEERTYEKAFSANLCEARKCPQELNSKVPPSSQSGKNETGLLNNSGKENKSPDKEGALKLQEYLKKHLIENFISRNDSSMKSVFQNLCNDAEKNNQLHFHHHEHHHHYYFDDAAMNNVETPFPDPEMKKSNFLKKTTGKSMSKHSSNSPTKADEARSKEYESAKKQNPPCDYVKHKGSEMEKPLKSSTFNSQLKTFNSLETIFCKKSDLVANYIYNDNDSKNIDSNEVVEGVWEAEKLVEKVSLGVDFNDEPRENEEDLLSDFAQKDKIEAVPSNSPKAAQVSSLIEELNRSWKANMKAELNNIKKDLQRLEQRHIIKRLKQKDGPNQISVYSNKTFIVGNEKLFLRKKREKENHPEKKEEPEVTVGYYFAKPEYKSREKRDFLLKKLASRKGRLYSNGAYYLPNKV